VTECFVSDTKNGLIREAFLKPGVTFPVGSHREIQDSFADKVSRTDAAPIEKKYLKNRFILPNHVSFSSDCIVREDLKMKRMALFFLTVCFIACACGAVLNAQTKDGSCTREDLNKISDQYFESIQEHKTSGLPLASTVKFTENGIAKEIGKGFWETAGKPLLRRTLIDTRKCVSATISVMEEPFSSKTVGSSSAGGMGGMGGFGGGGAPKVAPGGTPGGAPKLAPGGAPKAVPGGLPGGAGGMFGGSGPMPDEGTVRPILFAARLKVEKGKITEIETIVARERDFAFNAKGVLGTKDQDWNTVLPSEKRTSRKVLADAANNYFALFSEGSTVSVPFAQVCDRWENGVQTTAADHDCSPVSFRKAIGMSINHGPRRVWVDTEKGISIAFMAFGGGATASEKNPTGSGLVDCHMFRIRDGKVDLIQSIVGPNAASMGWPLEPIE
jgi:hypothetical protein